jgi:hypothetical protein
LRDIRDSIHTLDDSYLINKFNAASAHSPDDEFIQILLVEIKNRKLTIEDVLIKPDIH